MEIKQLLSHKSACCETPEMRYEELLGLATTGERYRVNIAQGMVKVKTTAIEDERKGKRVGGRKERKRRRSEY